MKPVVLSERLQAVVSMVTPGSRVCDVGCDHGFVSICLIERKISPSVLAMDVREGPLGAAREHVSERGLESFIEIRLSDGLHKYMIGEADSLICAGMGGRLMMRILRENQEKTESFRELILQPQSELEQFRAWLWEQGYRITDEKMVEEEGRFYPMMRVETSRKMGSDPCLTYTEPQHSGVLPGYNMESDELCKLFFRYGSRLLLRGDDTLKIYLQREERIYGEILTSLREQGQVDARRRKRYAEVEMLLRECRMAQEIMDSTERKYKGV